jgi:hypothetical protein
MIKQSSFKYWDRSVADFDGIYSGEGRTLLGRWLDRWLRRDIYVGVAEITRLINELGAGADRIGSVPERRGCPCRWRVPAAGSSGSIFPRRC